MGMVMGLWGCGYLPPAVSFSRGGLSEPRLQTDHS